VAGITEYLALSAQVSTPTIPVKTLIIFGSLAALVGVEYVFQQPGIVYPTVIAGIAAAVAYFQSEISAWIRAQLAPPASGSK
jgi:hypothetical protein